MIPAAFTRGRPTSRFLEALLRGSPGPFENFVGFTLRLTDHAGVSARRRRLRVGL